MNPFVFPAVAVDISDESFKYMRLRERDKVRIIEFYGEQELAKGIVDAGEITDAAKLAAALAETLAPQKKRYPYLILSLPEEKGFVRLIEIQEIPRDDVRSALTFQLEEHIPVPPQDLVFDYQVLERKEGDARGKMSVVVTAYPRATVLSYIDVAQRAGFTPIVLELESQAIARAVVPPSLKEPILVGDIGKTRTTFSIVDSGLVYFTSTVKMGGEAIDEVLVSSLHITPEEAREIKMGRGLDFSSQEVIAALTPVLATLKDEAVRQVDFWERKSRPGSPQITKAYLCGGDAHLRGLPEFFSHELKLMVSRAEIAGNVFNLARYIPPINAHDTLLYATAFGLALRSNEHVGEIL